MRETRGACGGGDERKAEKEHAQERSKAGGFRTGSHERRDRSGRAFINVRRPHMKGRGGDLETKTNQEHRCSGKQERRIERLVQASGDRRDVRRTGQGLSRGAAVNQRDAVQEKRGSKRAENEILERRFV